LFHFLSGKLNIIKFNYNLKNLPKFRWILLIFAHNFWMLLVGRFFLGLVGGAFCILAPLYSAEIAEK
jgi:MFS family permease